MAFQSVEADLGGRLSQRVRDAVDGRPAVPEMLAEHHLPQVLDAARVLADDQVAADAQPAAGVQGRFDAQGVSFANAQRLARHYLQAYQKVAPR